MSAPTLPDDAAVGPPERLHPLFLLSGLTGSLRRLAGAYAAIGYLLVTGRSTLALFGIVGLLAFGMAGVILYWRRFEYRVGEDEIRIDRGIFSRTHRSIPFDRVQDVDISQSPLQRILGLARVTFETGGGSSRAGGEEGALEAVTLERAEQIRSLVRSRRSAGRVAQSPEPVGETTPIYAMGIGRLLLAGTFNFSLALVAALVGFSQTVGNAVGLDPLSRRFWSDLVAASAPVQALVVSHRAVALAAGAALLVLVGLATGVARTVLRDYGFRLDRTQVGLRRRRGLFTRSDVTLAAKRAQALVVGTGPLRERFGWRDLKLQSLAGEADGKGDHLLAPLATECEIDRIAREIGWPPLPAQPEWKAVSSAYVWMRVVALGPLFLLFGLQAAVALLAPVIVSGEVRAAVLATIVPLLVPSVLLLLALLVAAAGRWFGWRRTAYALDEGRLLIRTGWWRRQLVILPVAKIQSIDLTENFITRWFGVATLRFGVAGGGLAGHSIPAIPSATGRGLRSELLGILT